MIPATITFVARSKQENSHSGKTIKFLTCLFKSRLDITDAI